MFLYKEDFDKFAEGLQETIERIRALQQSGEFQDADSVSDYDREDDYDRDHTYEENHSEENKGKVTSFTNVDFDDLED